MDKIRIIQALCEELAQSLSAALLAAQNTYDIATHEDNKAENKYDTRGLEASYLAGAQAERVRDLKESLGIISSLNVRHFTSSDKIAISALVELLSGQRASWVLLLPKGGGHSVRAENIDIKVVTPESPLGAALVGKLVGDEINLNYKNYEIQSVH